MFYKNILKVLVLSLPIFAAMQDNTALSMDSNNQLTTQQTKNSIENNTVEHDMVVNGCDLSKRPNKELMNSTLKTLENNRLPLLKVSFNEEYAVCYENLKSFINNIKNMRDILKTNTFDHNCVTQYLEIVFRCQALCNNMNEIARKSTDNDLKDKIINIQSNCLGITNYFAKPLIDVLTKHNIDINSYINSNKTNISEVNLDKNKINVKTDNKTTLNKK